MKQMPSSNYMSPKRLGMRRIKQFISIYKPEKMNSCTFNIHMLIGRGNRKCLARTSADRGFCMWMPLTTLGSLRSIQEGEMGLMQQSLHRCHIDSKRGMQLSGCLPTWGRKKLPF